MVSPDFDPLDLELEDPDEQPVEESRVILILWLVTIGMAIFFIALYQIFANFLNEARDLKSEIIPLQQRISTIDRPAADVEALIERVADAKKGVIELQALYPTLVASHFDWTGAMLAAAEYDSEQIVLEEIIQDDNILLISGRAVNDAAVVNYAQTLAFSGSFANVEIRSMNLSGEPLFTPTPTITPTATAEPTATPTPVPAGGNAGGGSGSGGGNQAGSGTGRPAQSAPLVDIYEVDDVIPGVIFMGEVQTHNFYPDYDMDTMRLLVKAGRIYRVSTLGLAPGVDTFLEISFDDRILVNDDSRPGTLASEIVFQGGLADTEALIRVSNLGLYDPDKVYQISVEEILPTPTATPGVVPTTPPLPTPTPTQAPVTPSPTPILGDGYEPNNTAPSTIAIGESQNHTFDPVGDVDMVSFMGKAGHHYKIFTDLLGLGVDTFLRVEGSGSVWESDDLGEPGSGIFSSGVCVPAQVDGPVTATVSNLTNQFGSSRTYSMNVEEIPGLFLEHTTVDFGVLAQGSTGPVVQSLMITSTQTLTWTYQSSADWIQINPITLTTPTTVDISLAVEQLPVGQFTEKITFEWDDFCTIEQTILVEIVPSGTDVGSMTLVAGPPAAPRFLQGRPAGRRMSIGRKVPAQAEVQFVISVELNSDLGGNNNE